MKGRYLLALTCLLLALAMPAGLAYGQTIPGFKLGFQALAAQIPNIVGKPLENEHWGPNGDALQKTSTGLMVWRKADNWTAFTDGNRTWINGLRGLQERFNDQRFDWEKEHSSQPAHTPNVRAMDEESAAPGAQVSAYMRELNARWATEWGWRPQQPVTVYLYFDGHRMADGIASITGLALPQTRKDEIAATTAGMKARDPQTGGWAVFMNLNRWYGTDRWAIRAKHLLTHEYTHVMQSDLAGGAGPTWFHEGMAEFAAFAEVPEATSFLDRTKYVVRHRDQGDLPSLRKLQEGWQEMAAARDERAQLAYGISHLAVKYLAGKVGGMQLLQTLESTAGGKDFEAALQSTTGYTLERLDAEYRQTIPPTAAQP